MSVVSGPSDPVTQDMLMAYADGALSPADAARVEVALASNPALRADVEAYRMTREALPHAFEGVLDAPVPDHLRALVMGETTAAAGRASPADPRATDDRVNVMALRPRREAPPVMRQPWLQAVAAVALVGVGLAVGALMQPVTKEDPGAAIASLLGRLDAATPIALALETAASATSVETPMGRIRVIQTFVTGEGAACREFEIAGPSAGAVGLACRDADAWTVKAMFAAAPAGDTSGFQPASGDSAAGLDAMLAAMNASIGLDADAESCLREAGWRDASACDTP